jgi:CheY-like chemotaxis protein
LCRAPESVKSAFHVAAPRELMARLRATPAAAETANPAPAEITRPLVLFVDDDAAARAIARRVVSSSGYGVVLAKDGNEALELAREYTPDMVITDAFMPGLDGRQLAKMIKSEMPKVKIVVVTSVYKDSRYKHEALRDFEVDDYHSKPLSPVDLRALLQKHLPR